MNRKRAAGRVSLASGPRLRAKSQQAIPAVDRLRLEMVGGGGFGDPFERDPNMVVDDVANGLISVDSAKADYGVILTDDRQVDEKATAERRDIR